MKTDHVLAPFRGASQDGWSGIGGRWLRAPGSPHSVSVYPKIGAKQCAHGNGRYAARSTTTHMFEIADMGLSRRSDRRLTAPNVYF
jgi:hypothetical protein